ncbi:MAG: hypothetical protein CVV53_01105 [Spirochaetae bacterium HGW-Spirochaetae-9]|nr:MAG: hypothetical protein CVV53_01105 [Spirochaetae bacterium HGW-Spirochaetae-9]
MNETDKIIIYQTEDGQANIETRLENDTVWLSQKMMMELFQTTKQNVSLHINNCYAEGELERERTVKEYLTVQQEGKRRIERPIDYYNLDVIISVGYRVKSKRGTQFRIWANRILKEHLVKGYTINKKRLMEQQSCLRELKESIGLVERSLLSEVHNIEEARSIIKVLADFASGLAILDDYDHKTLETKGKSPTQAVEISMDEFLEVVETMRGEFDSDIFGQQKDNSFDSSVSQMYQSFGGKELYPSIEHKAAMLLYLVIKNHSFVDGNKRIAAALFLYFLERNGLLYRPEGKRIISNDGLATLTLLIAISKPEEMATMINIILTILNRGQP